MPTPEQYELGAKNLIQRLKDNNSKVEKMQCMGYLANLRSSQYKTTGDPRAQRLAKNCRKAEERLLITAIRSFGFDKRLIAEHNWYAHRPKMEELKKRLANGEDLCKYDRMELAKYNAMIDEQRFDD